MINIDSGGTVYWKNIIYFYVFLITERCMTFRIIKKQTGIPALGTVERHLNGFHVHTTYTLYCQGDTTAFHVNLNGFHTHSLGDINIVLFVVSVHNHFIN